MAKYEPGDIATYYFVINKIAAKTGNLRQIQAWTDNKQLAIFYMDFHKCKNFTLKSVTKSIEEINAILEENIMDEIEIRPVAIKNPDKKGKRIKYVSVPMTKTETSLINEECNSMLSSMVSYSYLNGAIPYLKPKYQNALKQILLIDIINKVIHGKSPKILEEVELDQIMVLFKLLPNNFGR